ncbi:protein bicaudal C homolog 1 isoform X1 [Tachysurus ichikawai]
MAAGRSSVSGFMQQPEAQSSSDSPPPHGSEDEEQHGGAAAPHDPEWTEERFRVDRKKLELMLLGTSSAHKLNKKAGSAVLDALATNCMLPY